MTKINTIVFAISISMTVFAAAGLARAEGVPMGPMIDPYYTAQAGQCIDKLEQVCAPCAGSQYYNCGGCTTVINNTCAPVIRRANTDRKASGPTKAWVKRQINRAVSGLLSKKEFDAVVAEIRGEIADLKRRMDELEARQDATEIKVTHNEARITVNEARLNGHDEDIRELKDDVEKLKKADDEIRADVKALKDEVMFEIGAQFFGAPHLQSIGAAAGIQLRIADFTAVFGDLGLGYAFDKDIAVLAKGGLMFYLGETKSFGLGPVALFGHEGFDDDGDVEVGGGVELRYHHTSGFFIAGDIGLGGEGVLQVVGARPDGEDLTNRKWGLAVMGGLMIGGEF